MILDDLSKILICPTCSYRLMPTPGGKSFFCNNCSSNYEIFKGRIPILLNRESKKNIEEFYQTKQPPEMSNSLEKKKKDRLLRQAPGINLNHKREKNLLHCLGLLSNRGPKILTIGTFMPQGGKTTKLELQLRERFKDSLRMDITVRDDVDLVADGHRLPFISEYFDLIVAQATVKHLRDPIKFVGEVHRVLKPHGIFYCEVAYLLPYHRWPGDYVRFTPIGAIQLLKGFRIVDSNYIRGPSQTVADLISIYLAMLLSFNSRVLYSIMIKGVSWIIHPIKYFDLFLQKNQWSDLIGQVNYYISQKVSRNDDSI